MSSLGAPRFREPEIAGAALQMHRFSRRASPPNTIRPHDHRTCPYVAKTLLKTILVEPRATRLFEALFPQSRTHVSRVTAPTHHYLTQTRAPASASRLDTVAQASMGCSTTGPRPRRQASPTSPPKTRTARYDGPLAANTPRPRGASHRRFPTTPYGGAAESSRVAERVARVYEQRQAVPAAVSLRRSASLVPAGPAALSSQRLQQCVVAAEAARRRGQL